MIEFLPSVAGVDESVPTRRVASCGRISKEGWPLPPSPTSAGQVTLSGPQAAAAAPIDLATSSGVIAEKPFR